MQNIFSTPKTWIHKKTIILGIRCLFVFRPKLKEWQWLRSSHTWYDRCSRFPRPSPRITPDLPIRWVRTREEHHWFRMSFPLPQDIHSPAPCNRLATLRVAPVAALDPWSPPQWSPSTCRPHPLWSTQSRMTCTHYLAPGNWTRHIPQLQPKPGEVRH